MVSVNFILTASIVVLFGLVLTHSQMNLKTLLNPNNIWSTLQKTLRSRNYINILSLFILILLLSIQTTQSYILAVLFFIVITYFQKHTWSLIAEDQLMLIHIEFRKYVARRILRDKCTITHFTLPLYLYDVLVSEVEKFRDMYYDSLTDILVGFGIRDPEVELTDEHWDLYYMQARVFKYTKVEVHFPEDTLNTDEELLEAYNFWKKARDPRVNFNLVSRLPWDLPFNYEVNTFYKLFTTNLLVFYNFFKTTLVAVTLMFIYFLYTIFFFKIQFLKQLSVWFIIGMLYFWLMSGFNFFLKRYQYGKFTSQIQRFWKRTNTYFWLIEGFLILLFFYYYLNSSQEPLYMYDYSAINQEFLVSLHVAGMNVVLLSLVIYFMYFTMLRINSNSWTQLNLYLIIISSFIFFSFFIETYQFYYVVSVFNERLWVFNEDENLWSIDIDNPILRTKHQYLLVCLIAKYWHFLFIFLSWVFFLIKSFERRKVTYVLFGANLQNMVILYVLNFACYAQWFKWIYRRFFDLPYTWFMTNIDNKFVFRLFFEIKLLALNLFNYNISLYSYQNLVYKSLIMWNVDSLCMWKFI